MTAARESSHKLKGSFGIGIMEGSFGTGAPNRNGIFYRGRKVQREHSKRPRPIPVSGLRFL